MASKKTKLWTLGIFCLLSRLPAAGQSCAHTVTRSPVGPVMVFQNGLLLAQATGYNYSMAPGTFPIIGPVSFSIGDAFQVFFTRQVPLSFTFQGVKVSYIGYALWQETWTCTQGNKTPAAVLGSVQVCSGSGVSPAGPNAAWDASVTYGLGAVVNWAGASWLSLQPLNAGNQPDTSGLWWVAIGWNCAGLYAVSITLGDGTLLSILGPAMAIPAPAPGVTWAPVN